MVQIEKAYAGVHMHRRGDMLMHRAIHTFMQVFGEVGFLLIFLTRALGSWLNTSKYKVFNNTGLCTLFSSW